MSSSNFFINSFFDKPGGISGIISKVTTLDKTRSGYLIKLFFGHTNPALWATGITGTLACVAGTLYGLDKSYKPFTYLHLVLPIFAAAIVGGVGNPIGAIIGGFVIAFSELFITFAYKKIFYYLLPYEIVPNGLLQILSTDYKIAVSFIILVLVLLIKPTGIYKGKVI